MACARAIGRLAPEAATPALAGAATIGVVQVPRASHHALDVVAGAILGWTIEAVLDRVWPRTRRRRQR